MSKVFVRRFSAKLLRWVFSIAGRAYVPGAKLEDAMRIARRLNAKNMACTLGYFHNWLNPRHQESASQIADICREIIGSVSGLQPKGYISIKAPALDYAPEIIAAIADRAREQEVLMHFDSHEPITADATLGCVKHALSRGARVGLTVPGRWRRSQADADLACELGVRVRVVKGEWADPIDPDIDMRQGFLNVIDRLAGRAREVAVATHDPWLARESLLRLRSAGTFCEIELLNGLPKRRLLSLAKEFSVPVRVYIPFGISWRPYALSKVAGNPRVFYWIVRDSILGVFLGLLRK